MSEMTQLIINIWLFFLFFLLLSDFTLVIFLHFFSADIVDLFISNSTMISHTCISVSSLFISSCQLISCIFSFYFLAVYILHNLG